MMTIIDVMVSVLLHQPLENITSLTCGNRFPTIVPTQKEVLVKKCQCNFIKQSRIILNLYLLLRYVSILTVIVRWYTIRHQAILLKFLRILAVFADYDGTFMIATCSYSL
jgi:hypothetical protein